TYTYTSEDGTVTTVDVPSDIVNQFGNIVTDGPVTVDGNTYNTIEEYIEGLDTNTTNASLTQDGTNLIVTDSEGNTVTMPLSELAGTDADTNTTNVSLTEDGTNLILTDSEGNTVQVALADISSKSVVTPVVTTGNIIATHDDGDGTTVDIKETITSMIQDDVTGVITYTPESGTATTADVVSKDTNNEITVGADGGAFYRKENKIVEQTGSYTIAATDETVLVDATGGATLTIPAADAANEGRILTIRKMDTAYGVLTLSQTITMANGTTFNNTNVNTTLRIQSDG